MIELLYIACRQPDLIAIGTVAVRRFPDQFFLRQLSFHRIFDRYGRIRGSRYAHGLIHIRPPGKRIADRTPKAGRRAAERLDLGRMVMRLVFKIHEPLFRFAVHFHRNDNRAGIDLVRFLLIV